MSYQYQKERSWVFTADGVKALLETILKMNEATQVFLVTEVMVCSDSFQSLACIDFLEEMGWITLENPHEIRNNFIYRKRKLI